LPIDRTTAPTVVSAGIVAPAVVGSVDGQPNASAPARIVRFAPVAAASLL
jgi:hypothetical protein